MLQTKNDMVEQIFAATEHLIATNGLHNLSMHKIAKAAGISPGTIYIHFKNKEELLTRLTRHIFLYFQIELAKNYDEEASFFEQYRQMWWNVWNLLQANPPIILNISQYKLLDGFAEICLEYKESPQNFWHVFCTKAQAAGMLCELSSDDLFTMTLETAVQFAFKSIYFKEKFSNELLEFVIRRTWNAILR